MPVKLSRVGYQTYEIVNGPARGTIIRRSSGPSFPARRWSAVAGPGAFQCLTSGFSLRGLAEAIARSSDGGTCSVPARRA